MNIECPEEIPDESVPMKITLYDNRIDAWEDSCAPKARFM